MKTQGRHFETVPLEVVRGIAREFPAQIRVSLEGRGDISLPYPTSSTEGQLQRAQISQAHDSPRPETDPKQSWRGLAEAVQQETDPRKMMALVSQLIGKLDEELGPRGDRRNRG